MYIGSYVFIKECCVSELRKKDPELASSLAYKVGKIVGFDGATWTFNVKFGDEEYSLRRYQLEEISEKELQLVNSISGNWNKMSSVQSYYVIAGMDLSAFKTDKYKGWQWSEAWENYTCNQSRGKIQLFDDPTYLYIGYILAAGDEYGFNTAMIKPEEIEKHRQQVIEEIKRLVKIGVISEKVLDSIDYGLIVFADYR